MKSASILNDKKIVLRFPFDLATIDVVKTIPGRMWDSTKHYWIAPLSSWHCQRVIELLEPRGFEIDPEIVSRATKTEKLPDLKDTVGLYPFQQEGVRFINRARGRVILADEMGLGKTITSLAYVQQVARKILVVCPSNVLYKWNVEAGKWAPSLQCGIYPIGKKPIEKEENIHIMSYGIMVTKYNELKEVGYDAVIFDEAHQIKNSKAMRTRVSRALVKDGIPIVLFLSGTPFMNRPSELFTLLNMIDPVGYANFYSFAQRYCGAIYLDKAWYFPPNGATNLEELSERLSTIMLRRTKREVLKDLPDLTRSTVPVDITNVSEYKGAVRNLKEWLAKNDKETLSSEHVLTRLNVLRQIVGEGKIAAALELVESIRNDGKKAVLFCHHKKVVQKLSKALEKTNRVGIISGDVPPAKRQALIERFQESNEALSVDSPLDIMIITVAGAEGIDLFAASDIIFVEREWTPAREEQAESRLHRNGQKNPVIAWYVVASGTIDEKFDRLVRSKRKAFQKVIRTDEILELIKEL